MHKLVFSLWCAVVLAVALPSLAQTTVNPTQLQAVTPLDAAWRFHAGDNLAYAAASFDDATWPLVKPGQPFAALHLPNVPGGYVWQRLQLHLQNPGQPLAVRLTLNADLPYEVFANGHLLYTSPSMEARVRQTAQPTAIKIPSSPNVQLAVRAFVPPPLVLHFLPIHNAEIGPAQALADSSRLAALSSFDEKELAEYLDSLVFLSVVPIAFTLYFFQRAHLEYLALAAFALNLALFYLVDTLMLSGQIPVTTVLQIFVRYLAWFCLITGIEFVARFSLVRGFLPIRIFQACILLFPWFPYLGDGFYNLAIIPGIAAFFLLAGHYLGSAWRRGRREIALLMPPVLFWTAILLYGFSTQFLPAAFRLPEYLHFGPIGVSLDHIGSLILISGIVGVVLYRFIHVSREEQRAASELEAARTVQQVLIPEALPEIAGLRILSAYHPAQSVGGDFFQILPAPDGACLIVLGDVAGKGLQAAMAVSVLVGAIRAMAAYTSSPAEMLAGLNRILFGRQSSFTTCLALHIAADGRVTAANAGHLHPYLNGKELALEPNLPLGFAAPDDSASSYTETHFFLGPEDTLTLLTDGVPEAANPQTKELFGFTRTQTISGQSPQTIARTAQAFGQNDDITVLSLSRFVA
jgi:hypothetical protein